MSYGPLRGRKGMRFEGFHINGFGLFHDILVKGLSPNLTVFLGDLPLDPDKD